MLGNTHTLKQDLANIDGTEEKLKLIRNTAAGEDCFLLTCGPSLGLYSKEQYAEMLSDKLVISMKQALDVAPDISDYHVLNSWNARRYDYSDPPPIIMFERNRKDPPVIGPRDIELDVPEPSDRSQQLVLTGAFEEHTFDKKADRPWGPGVMFEMGFFLAVHLGARRIFAVGWDLGQRNSSTMDHFYNENTALERLLFRRGMQIGDRHERARFFHDTDVTYNRPRIIPEEVDDRARGTYELYKWLQKRKIELAIISDVSLVDERVPRVRLEDVASRSDRS